MYWLYCSTHCTPTTLHTAPCHTVLRPTLEPQSQHSSDLVFFPQISPGVDPYPKPTFDPCIRPTQTPSSQRVWPAEQHTRKPVCCYGTPRSDYLGHSQFYPIGIVWIFPSSSETKCCTQPYVPRNFLPALTKSPVAHPWTTFHCPADQLLGLHCSPETKSARPECVQNPHRDFSHRLSTCIPYP